VDGLVSIAEALVRLNLIYCRCQKGWHSPVTQLPKKKSVKREFLSLRVVARKMNDTKMMYKNLAIDCMYF